jgi:serine/threonine protein kinase
MTTFNQVCLRRRIGSGAFGEVFEGVHTITRERIAVKMSSATTTLNTLTHEARVYKLLGSRPGFCEMKLYGMQGGFRYLGMTLLGDPLDSRVRRKGRLTSKEVSTVGQQMVRRVQTLHEVGIVHRDISPPNFMFGVGPQSTTVHLVDFGLSTSISGTLKRTSEMIGTRTYTGINVHEHISPMRRDDLESCLYVLQFAANGMIGWDEGDCASELMRHKRTAASLHKWAPMFSCVWKRRVNDTPDYDELVHIISRYASLP